jgi:uncharacterized protein (DUF433 family)/predicted nuclease of predicted toxin-antitoxin system
MANAVKTEHFHIVRLEGVCGGEPVVDGLRVALRHVATLHVRGETVPEIAEALGLTEAQVFHAPSYFSDDRDEITALMAQEGQAHAGFARPETLFARLYIDRHIVRRLADDLRGRGFDVLTTKEAGLDTPTDEEQLTFAVAEGRAILTFNIRDFAQLHTQWLAEGRFHAGIIVSGQLGRRQNGLLLERTLRVLDHFTADELKSNIVHVEQFK